MTHDQLPRMGGFRKVAGAGAVILTALVVAAGFEFIPTAERPILAATSSEFPLDNAAQKLDVAAKQLAHAILLDMALPETQSIQEAEAFISNDDAVSAGGTMPILEAKLTQSHAIDLSMQTTTAAHEQISVATTFNLGEAAVNQIRDREQHQEPLTTTYFASLVDRGDTTVSAVFVQEPGAGNPARVIYRSGPADIASTISYNNEGVTNVPITEQNAQVSVDNFVSLAEQTLIDLQSRVPR